MKLLRSPTLLGLVLLGFILVALPLAVTLFTAIAQVDRLARESRLNILTVQQDTTSSRALAERAQSMERSARQFLALEDPSFRDLYHEHRELAMELLDRIGRPRQEPRLGAAVAVARRAIEELSAQLDEPTAEIDRERVGAALDRLRETVEAVTAEQATLAREVARSLPENAQRLERALIAQAALVLPVSAVLAAFCIALIAAPLRRIRHTIRALGRGDLGERVVPRGTRDLQEVGQRLEWLRTRLIELEAQKSRFLRNVSHELKTPLTNIREGAELLADATATPKPDEQRQVAEIVRDNSIRLQQMIESLLRYGAEGDVSAGEPNQQVQLAELVLEVIERQQPAASARAVTIDHSLAPVELSGNLKRLQVIVDNLVGNALKYTPGGGRIQVRLGIVDGLAALDVEDDGPGVPAADREKIFEWFYTGPRPEGALVAGTGIGLAIAQDYARQHNGYIELLPTDSGAHFRWVINRGAE